LAGERFGGGEEPGGEEYAAHGMLSGGLQADAGGTAPSPGTRAGFKDSRVSPHEHSLLDGSEFGHAPTVFRVAESSEDLSSDTKIGVVHVGMLGRFREAESEVAEVIGGHGSGVRIEGAIEARKRYRGKGLTFGCLYCIFCINRNK
jgi:hypothetical protein